MGRMARAWLMAAVVMVMASVGWGDLSVGSGDGFSRWGATPWGQPIGYYDPWGELGEEGLAYSALLLKYYDQGDGDPNYRCAFVDDWKPLLYGTHRHPTITSDTVTDTTRTSSMVLSEVPAGHKLENISIDLVQTAHREYISRDWTFHNSGTEDVSVRLIRYADHDPSWGVGWTKNLAVYPGYMGDGQYSPQSIGTRNFENTVWSTEWADGPEEHYTFEGWIGRVESPKYYGAGTAMSSAYNQHEWNLPEHLNSIRDISNYWDDPGVPFDLDGDGYSDGYGDAAGMLQGTLTIPAGQSAEYYERTIWGTVGHTMLLDYSGMQLGDDVGGWGMHGNDNGGTVELVADPRNEPGDQDAVFRLQDPTGEPVELEAPPITWDQMVFEGGLPKVALSFDYLFGSAGFLKIYINDELVDCVEAPAPGEPGRESWLSYDKTFTRWSMTNTLSFELTNTGDPVVYLDEIQLTGTGIIVPEPASLSLVALVGVVLVGRRRRHGRG